MVRDHPGRARVETRRIVVEAAASAADLVLANWSVIDATVATLVHGESLEGEASDQFRVAEAPPKRSPMNLVAC